MRKSALNREAFRKKEARSQAEIDMILCQDPPTYPFYAEHLRKFVMLKFSLEPSDMEESDDLDQLSSVSISKALKISKELVADFEAGENCEGATSSDVKRSLLLVKIQELLSVELSLLELMEIETVEDVARLTWPHFLENRKTPLTASSSC